MGILHRAALVRLCGRNEGPRRSSQVQTSEVSRLCENCEIASTCSVISPWSEGYICETVGLEPL